MSEPLGGLIDSLGVKHAPEEGELVTDAIVILKTIDPKGRVGLRMAYSCLLYTSPSPRDRTRSRMPSSA